MLKKRKPLASLENSPDLISTEQESPQARQRPRKPRNGTKSETATGK